MKKVKMALAAALMLQSCEYVATSEMVKTKPTASRQKTVTFRISGAEWETEGDGLTRGSMSADGNEMTDLWIFDYMGDELVQMQAYTPSDKDWGAPSLTFSIGTHNVYFVASRGDSPTVDDEARTIVWGTPKDTFWSSLTLNVTSGGSTSQSVTLNRVATKMRVQIADEVPSGLATVNVTPATWYYGLNYATGAATAADSRERSVSVPASYIGTTDQLVASFFGLSNSTEWTTDITITAKDGDGHTIGSAFVSGAPFQRNRVTGLSGSLFASVSATGITLDDEWADEYAATW